MQDKVRVGIIGVGQIGKFHVQTYKETPEAEIVAEVVKLVRNQIGPVAAFKLAVVVDRLPKTRSGKILRSIMARIADGQPFKMPATIDDPAILDEIRTAIQPLGYGKEAHQP